MHRSVVIRSTIVLLMTFQVQSCLVKEQDASKFWAWLYPTFDKEAIDEGFLSKQEKLFEISENNVDIGNGLEDFDDLQELHISRQRRTPFVDVDPNFYAEDELEPLERDERMILNKADAADNKTATIKQLNAGYFEIKYKFEHPEPAGNATGGNGTAAAAGGAAPAAATPAPA